MAEHPDGSVPQQLPSLDQNLESLLQTSSPLAFPERPRFQQPATGSFCRRTPQTTRLLAEDLQSQPACDAEKTQISKTLAAPAQTQNFFIHTTSILKATFLRTSTPTDTEITQLAAETGLDKYGVYTWFDIVRGLSNVGGAKALPTPEVTQAYVPSISSFGNVSEVYPTPLIDLDPSCIVEDIPIWPPQTKAPRRQRRSWTNIPRPSKRQRKERLPQTKESSLVLENQLEFPQRQPSKASEKGQYYCPTCRFKTGKMDQWYTHQSRRHFPVEIFVCGINPREKPCNMGPEHPCMRKDNFITHLKHLHGFQPGQILDDEVSKRTVKVMGLFHDKCGFRFCQKTLDTREESMRHIGAHIESGANINDWVHQCTSLDHKIQHRVHFEIPSDKSEMGDDTSNDGDSDQDDFSGWTQGGDFDTGDGGAPFDADSEQDPGQGSSYSGAGGAYPPMRFTAAVSRRMDTPKRIILLEGLEQDSTPVRPLESLTVRRTLGHGGSGTVFEVSHVGSKDTFALKRFKSSRAPDYDAFKNEVQAMKALRHPHIVEFLDSYVRSGSFSILMAPVADMDLSRYLRTANQLLLDSSAFLKRSTALLRGMSCLVDALAYIHSGTSSTMSHCDIKPANILVKNDTFLITDFGISTVGSLAGISTKENVQVTPEYAAPETMKSGTQSRASDVFALGCVFLEISTVIMSRSLSDFADFRVLELGDKSYHKSLEKTNEWIDMLEEEQKHKKCSDLFHSIPFDTIHRMLSRNPEDRPTAQEIWLRFPKCTCCSDWQPTKHWPPSSQDEVEDQALHANCTPSATVNPSATNDGDLVNSKLPHTLDPNEASLDGLQNFTAHGEYIDAPVTHRPQDESPDVDIIAVHSIDSDDRKTSSRAEPWTWKDDVNSSPSWLRDMISEDLPRARVLIYGYDLSSTAAISEHARHLLEKLTNARKTCPERPILFVAHSLGGVILKQALINAKEECAYSGLYRETRGIVFLSASKSSCELDVGNLVMARQSNLPTGNSHGALAGIGAQFEVAQLNAEPCVSTIGSPLICQSNGSCHTECGLISRTLNGALLSFGSVGDLSQGVTSSTLLQVEELRETVHVLNKEWIRRCQSTPNLVPRASALSPGSLFVTGVRTLQHVFRGVLPRTFEAVYALAHITCACAYIMHGDDTSHCWTEFFQDILKWQYLMLNDSDAQVFIQLVNLLWWPRGSSAKLSCGKYFLDETSGTLVPLRRPTAGFDASSSPETDDPQPPRWSPASMSLLTSLRTGAVFRECSRFLDEIEYSGIMERSRQYPTHQPWYAQNHVTNIEEMLKTIVRPLQSCDGTESLHGSIDLTATELRNGSLRSVREVEVSLISNGKSSCLSPQVYKRYFDAVTSICDRAMHEAGPNWRDRCYATHLDVVLISVVEMDNRQRLEHIVSRHGRSNEVDQNPDTKQTLADSNLEPSSTESQTLIDASPSTITSSTFTNESSPKTQPSSTATPESSFSAPSPSSNINVTHCPLCPAQFTGSLRDRSSNLRRHMRTTRNHGTFVALLSTVPGCNAVISRSDNLGKHIRTVHEGDKSTMLRRQGARKRRRDGDNTEEFLQASGQ